MKAISFSNNNEGELSVVTLPLLHPAPHEVLIKVHAAGLNRADLLQRKGKYPPPDGASDILGMEVAGKIAALGSAVTGFAIGDNVCALLEGGGYAQYALAAATQTLPIPQGLDYVQAASIPEAAFTVWSNLFDIANLKTTETLLIHGGASGIGVMAIQIAAAFGIKCYATAGSDKKCTFLEQLGAIAINYNKQNFSETINDIDVIIDIVGGSYFQKNLNILNKYGRLICLSFLGGAKAEVNFTPMLVKNLQITGTTLRNKSKEEKASICLKLKENIWPLLENGTIKPIIDSVFNIDDVEKAHQYMQDNKNTGKIILKLW